MIDKIYGKVKTWGRDNPSLVVGRVNVLDGCSYWWIPYNSYSNSEHNILHFRPVKDKSMVSVLCYNLYALANRVLRFLPFSIPFHPNTTGDTVGTWIPFSCFPHLCCFLNDAAVVAVVELYDASRGINPMPASVLNRLNKTLTHNWPRYLSCQLSQTFSNSRTH